MSRDDYREYGGHYDEETFWSKLTDLPASAGREVARKSLTLWCVLTSDETPAWAKVLITGALGYFVLPIDLIPDMLPCGFLDDICAMSICLSEVDAFVTKEIEARVEGRLPARFRRGPPPPS